MGESYKAIDLDETSSFYMMSHFYTLFNSIDERRIMETVTIRFRIPLDKWAKMTEKEISRIVVFHSGQLYDATCDGNFVELVILAPSTWKTILLQKYLSGYRYC